MRIPACILMIAFCWSPDLPAQGSAQEAGFGDTLRVWDGGITRIAADPLGQFYLIKNGLLIKYSADGDSLYSWSEPLSGEITHIDTGDPMRILVYHQEFNLLRFLNNRLAPLSEPIRLDEAGLTSPWAIATARQGGFWILDGMTRRIRHIGTQLETLAESAPLDLRPKQDHPPCVLAESGNQLMLLIPYDGILVFDHFANLIKRIPVTARTFHPAGDRLLLIYPNRITLWTNTAEPEYRVSTGRDDAYLEGCLLPNKLLIRTSEKVLLKGMKK